MNIEIGKSWSKKLQGRVEKYQFEIGVLDDHEYRNAKNTPRFDDPQLGYYAGGPIRKTENSKSDKTVGQILVDNMKRLNINLLTDPFHRKNSEILRFTDAFLRMVAGKNISIRRIENLLQAIVRNPILRGDYGNNSAITADEKGFDRHLIDTAQTFKAIKVKARSV